MAMVRDVLLHLVPLAQAGVQRHATQGAGTKDGMGQGDEDQVCVGGG